VPPTTPSASPSASAPPAVAVERCAGSITFGSIEVVSEGGCLARRGLVWETSGPVDVSGIHGTPVGAARAVVDPLNARITAQGYDWTLRGTLLAGTDLAREWRVGLGPLALDWTFQYDRDPSALLGGDVSEAQITARTDQLSRQPGLTDLRSLPEVRRGVRDFSVLDDAAVGAYVTRYPEVNSSHPVFGFPAIGLTGFRSLKVDVPALLTETLFGLTVESGITLTPEARHGTFGFVTEASLKLPSVLKGYRGSAKVFVGADGSVDIDRSEVVVPELVVGPVTLRPVDLRYDASADAWKASVGVYLGITRSAPGLFGEVAVRGGELQRIAVVLRGAPVPIGTTGLFLTGLGGSLALEPFGVGGSLSVRFGPTLAGSGGGFDVDGSGTVDQDQVTLAGRLSVLGAQLGEVRLGARSGDRVFVDGTFERYFDDRRQLGLSGTMEGFANGDTVQLGASVRLALSGLGSLGGEAMVSDVGIAACGSLGGTWFGGWRFGFGYRWGQDAPDLLGATCNTRTSLLKVRTAAGTSPTTARRAAAPSGAGSGVLVAVHADPAATGPTTVSVPEGERVLALWMGAPGGLGAVRVTGPDGTVIDTSEVGAYHDGDRVAVVHDVGSHQWALLVGRPASGRWTVEPLDGTPVSVTAEVTAEGFRPVEPATPVPVASATTTASGLVVPPTLPSVTPAAAGPRSSATTPTSDRADARERSLAPIDRGGRAAWVWFVVLGVALLVGVAAVVVVVRRRRAPR